LAYGSLTSSQLANFAKWRFSSPHEAGLKAIEDPDFGPMFEDLGPIQVVEHNGHLHVVPPAAIDDRFWDIVYAWAEVRQDVGPKGESGKRGARTGRRKGTAGAPDAFYDRSEIKRVLLAWRRRETAPQQISRTSLARPGFSRTAVRRVIRLDENGAFRLGARGGLKLLGINGEFRAAPTRISLRALERSLGLEPLA
jgi:hypothetical protein